MNSKAIFGAACLAVLLPTLPISCRGLDFVGKSDDKGGRSSPRKNGNGIDGTLQSGDLVVTCGVSQWNKAALAKTKRLLIPLICPSEITENLPQNRSLDLVFVLDVTGSMRSEIDAVRAGVNDLVTVMTTQGWNLRAGAVAFADSILEETALSADLPKLMESMSPENEHWQCPPGFGGDVPEIGMAALERGLHLLGEADPNHDVPEKVILYVSDAPAKRVDKGKFETSPTAFEFRRFVNNLQGRSSFRYFYSTASRSDIGYDRRITEDMPEPNAQMTAFVNGSGVSSVRLPFPLNAKNVKEHFIAKLEAGRVKTEPCPLTSFSLKSPQGTEVLTVTNLGSSEGQFFWTEAIPRGLPSGTYTLELARNCANEGPQIVPIALEL